MAIWYVDPVNGDNTKSGNSFANRRLSINTNNTTSPLISIICIIKDADAKPPLPSWVFVRLGCSKRLLGSSRDRAESARDCQRSPRSAPRAAKERP